MRESGLSTGAVYGRFKSKNDLLREAIVTRSAHAARLGDEGFERVADLIAAGVTRTDAPLTDAEALRPDVAGRPVYLALAMDEENVVRMKPQNLLLNLPFAQPS